jgi:hypothetical protein
VNTGPLQQGTPEPSAGIPRNVKALGAVSLLTAASSEMVYPVLPLFLANVLGAALMPAAAALLAVVPARKPDQLD